MRCCFFLILFSIALAIRAQSDLRIVNYYGYRDGLNNLIVDCLHQDSRGFLWIGTKEGLNRFDGYQFRKYFSERNNPNSLSHNKVLQIMEYQPGHLLIATSSGLSVLNTFTGAFENEKIRFAPLQGGSGTVVSSMFLDREQKIWINHSGEIDVLDKNLNYLYRLTDLSWTKALKGVLCRYEAWYMDQQGRLWIPSDESGIHIIDLPNEKVFNHSQNPDQLPYLTNSSIRSFLFDEKEQILWVGAWGEGLIRYHLATGNVTQEYFEITERGESRSINALQLTENGKLLFFINGRCCTLDPQTMAYQEVSMAEGVHTDARNQRMGCITILRSDDDRYWIGGTGLYMLDDTRTQSDLVVVQEEESKDCSDLMVSRSGIIYSLHDDRLLVSADLTSNKVAHYTIPGQSQAADLCEDHTGQLWIGTTKGIQVFHPVSGTFHKPSFIFPTAGLRVEEANELNNASVNALFLDRENNMWITTRDPFHLYHFESSTGLTQQIAVEKTKQFRDVSVSGRISAITGDSHGRIWMSSMLGGALLSYDLNSDQWTTYPSGKENFRFLVNKGITSVQPDPAEDVLWLSTVYGDGLIAYHVGNDSLVQFTREHGLLSDYVQTITMDKKNQLWLSSEFGVTQFNPSTGQASANILFEPERYAFETFQAAFQESSDQLVLSIHDRYIFIPTAGDTSKTLLPAPLLDRLFINNKQLFLDLADTELRFQHTQKNISFDFTAVQYKNADKLQFAYQLAGADEEWKYTTQNRSAQYASLSPGSYTFLLKVADESGTWGPEHQMLSFTIVPPFWKTFWFILGIIAITAFAVFWLVRKRIRMIRHEAGLKQKIAETEMMALRAQMNPHFIFNCINSIDSLIQDNDKYHATIYLNKFAKLIRGILDSSHQNVVPLGKDLETLKLYIEMERFRNENKFIAEVHADPSLLQDDFKVPPLIIQPYVENAIVHGLRYRDDREGKLSIRLKHLDGRIQYIIEDNGVGRAYAQNGHKDPKRSYGMQMSSDRVKLFNQEETASVEITDLHHNGTPAGTRVEVSLNII